MADAFDESSNLLCPNCGSVSVSEVIGYCLIENDSNNDRLEDTTLVFSEEPIKEEIAETKGVWYCLSCDSLFDRENVVYVKKA